MLVAPEAGAPRARRVGADSIAAIVAGPGARSAWPARPEPSLTGASMTEQVLTGPGEATLVEATPVVADPAELEPVTPTPTGAVPAPDETALLPAAEARPEA